MDSDNPALCAVWGCADPAVAASHCRSHQYLAKENEVDQGGPVSPSADQAFSPKKAKRTAKRTGALSIKRSIEVKSQPARDPADTNTPSSKTISFEERNKAWLPKVSKKARTLGNSRVDEAPPRSQGGPFHTSLESVTPSSNPNPVVPWILDHSQSQTSNRLDKSPLAIEKSARGSVPSNEGGTMQDHESRATMSRECQNPPPSEMAIRPSSKSQPGLPPNQSPLPPVSTAPPASELKTSDEAERPQVVQRVKDDSSVVKPSIPGGCALENGLEVKGRSSKSNKRKRAALQDLDSTLQSGDNLRGAQQGSPIKTTLRADSNLRPEAFAISAGLRGLDRKKPLPLQPPKKQQGVRATNETENRQASEPIVPLLQQQVTLVRRATTSPTRQAPKLNAETKGKAVVEANPNFTDLHFGLQNAPPERSPPVVVRFSSDQPPLGQLIEVDEDISFSVEKSSTAQDAPSKPLTPSEELRKSVIAKFESATFDSIILRQSTLTPPSSDTGVLPTIEPSKSKPAEDSERLYLPVNPAIHRIHKRSDEWHEKKAQEIEARGGRKFWCGKFVKRTLWLRAKEEEKLKEKLNAFAQGRPPLSSDPEPWSFNRRLDFGDVPEDELPEYVRSNPSWVKACEWFREVHAERGKGFDEQRKEMEDRRIQAQRALISEAQKTSEHYLSLVDNIQKRKRSRKEN